MFALEKKLGMGNGTIGKWGKNGRIPNYAKLSAVCDALGVSVADIMEDDSAQFGAEKTPVKADVLSDAKRTLLDSIDDLSDEQCAKLLGIIKEAKKLL